MWRILVTEMLTALSVVVLVSVSVGSAAEAQKIAALGYRHELDDTFGEALEQAQAQVSKTDRFQGGQIKPEGLGVKR